MSQSLLTIGKPSLAIAKFWRMPELAKLDLRFREWVYFLESQVEPRLIKIGRSRNLKFRILGIQSQCPVELKLIAVVDAPAGTEWILHEQFADERQHGEWYLPSERLLALVAQLPEGGKLKQTEVPLLFPQIDCQKYFWKALDRKSPSGVRASLLEPTSRKELKRMQRLAKRRGDANGAAVLRNYEEREPMPHEVRPFAK